MPSYSVEFMLPNKAELEPLLRLHWEEIDDSPFDLNFDWARYETLEDAGLLVFIAVRDEGELVGYHILNVLTHSYHRHVAVAFSDLYFIHPDWRNGRNGIDLFKFTEEYMKKLGVQQIVMTTKEKFNVGKIFKRLGYRKSADVLVKEI